MKCCEYDQRWTTFIYAPFLDNCSLLYTFPDLTLWGVFLNLKNWYSPHPPLLGNSDLRNLSILWVSPGNTYWGGRLSTIDLLTKTGCFVTWVNNIFNIKRSWSKLLSTRRSTVLSLPLPQDFPGFSNPFFNMESIIRYWNTTWCFMQYLLTFMTDDDITFTNFSKEINHQFKISLIKIVNAKFAPKIRNYLKKCLLTW